MDEFDEQDNRLSVTADSIYQCDMCNNDYHAEWTCPNCKAKNSLNYWEDNDQFNSDICQRCKIAVRISRERDIDYEQT